MRKFGRRGTKKASEPGRQVVIVAMGGTIQAEGKNRLDLSAYMETKRRLDPRELVSRIPELAQFAEVKVVDFFSGPSMALDSHVWLRLWRLISKIADDGLTDGVVITHGTNTLEETAYFLHLTLKASLPTVLVGAMRPASALSWDGGLNLVNAVRCAQSPSAEDMGVLVVMNEEIYSARDVTKSATYRVNAFSGRDLGPLGFVDSDNRVIFYHRPTRPHTKQTVFDVARRRDLPRIALLPSHIGVQADLIDAAVTAGVRGIVIAGSGAGGVTPDQEASLRRARDRGVLVCLSSRVGSGRVVQRAAWSSQDFVTSDNLVPWKACILLSLAIMKTRRPAEIQRMFDVY